MQKAESFGTSFRLNPGLSSTRTAEIHRPYIAFKIDPTELRDRLSRPAQSERAHPAPGAERAPEKYGDDFEAVLKGKPVEVMGWVKQTKISFTANSVDTVKFYCQTHVIMHSADQIQLLEDRPAPRDQHEKLDVRDVKT